MEITEVGNRCFRCSQAAAIAQHERNRAEAIRSHNKTVIAFGGFRFWRLKFHCTECNTELDAAPGLLAISRPPPEIGCEKCGAAYKLDFWQRARWWSSSLFKVCFPVAVALRYRSLGAAIASRSTAEILTTLLFDLVIASLAAVVLAIPAGLASGGKPAPR
jgi:hypothetical protein